MCESFKQSPPLNCRNICGGRGHACISGGKAPLISHEVATIHEQVAKRIANVRFTTRMYKIHCLQGELWEQHCNRSFSGELLEKQGRRSRSFLQAHFLLVFLGNFLPKKQYIILVRQTSICPKSCCNFPKVSIHCLIEIQLERSYEDETNYQGYHNRRIITGRP